MEHLDNELARAFVAGELAADAHARWEAHLKHCSRCRALVEREQAWPELLKLDQEPPRLNGAVERVLASLGHRSRAARLAPLLLLGAVAALLGVALGLGYRVATTPSPIERSAAELGISTKLQGQVIRNLDSLEVLACEPWLPENYAAARWLARLARNNGGGQ